MNCETARGLVPALVMDGLGEDERRRVEAHLSTCDECRTELEALESLWHRLGAAAAPDPSVEARARLAEAVGSFRAEVDGAERAQARPRRPWRALVQLAASLVLFAGGVLTGTLVSRDEPQPAAAAADGASFLVLMRGDGNTPAVSAAMDVWLAGLRADERLIGGAQVAQADGAWIGAAPDPFGMGGVFELFGYIVIRARDADEARAIVSAAPNIGASGAIEIWSLR